MSSVNLYDVLDVKQDCNMEEIKKAYIRLSKRFHPDKKNGDPEMFELIVHAYGILSNPETRKEYDKLYKIIKRSDKSHEELKYQSQKYYETEIVSKKPEDAIKDFKKEFEYMDKKVNYDRKIENKKLNTNEISRMIDDLRLTREQEDIENIHENIFEDNFNLSKFNAVFDELHKDSKEIIPHNDKPTPWNEIQGLNDNYGNIDSYDELFDDDQNNVLNNNYSSINISMPVKKVNKKDITKINNANYTTTHNFKDDNYKKSIQEKLKERELQTQQLQDRKLSDYEKPTFGGYGIFENIGIDLNNAELLDDIDIKRKYQKLLLERNKNQ